MAQIVSLHSAVVAINKKFDKQIDHDRAADRGVRAGQRCRLEAGQLLLTLRKRIARGEAGAEWKENWWGWYKTQPFIRSRRDANKVMKIAAADDPEAAHTEAKTKAREGMARVRANRKLVSPKCDPEVARLLHDVLELTGKQQRQFVDGLKAHGVINVAEGDELTTEQFGALTDQQSATEH